MVIVIQTFPLTSSSSNGRQFIQYLLVYYADDDRPGESDYINQFAITSKILDNIHEVSNHILHILIRQFRMQRQRNLIFKQMIRIRIILNVKS